MENQTMTETTDTEAEPSVEENSASDLDSLLKEYDESAPEPEKGPEQKVAQDSELKDRMARYDAVINRFEQKQIDEDIAASVKVAQSFTGRDDISDEDVEAHLYWMAAKDERFKQAFERRDQNPDKWRSLLRAVGEKFANRAEPKATHDWRAVQSAVRSAQTSSPKTEEAPNVKKMTDAEFLAYKRSLLGD